MKKLMICFFLLTVVRMQAAILQKTIEYQQDKTTLEGVLVYDDAWTHDDKLRPGVLVVHQQMGLGDYEIGRAEMLVKLGYVAFCADIYGKGVRPKNEQEAAVLVDKYKKDRQLLRARVNAGFEVLINSGQASQFQLAAIGYGFGGTAVLELARSGASVRSWAPLQGVVSFHGDLDSPSPKDNQGINCSILILAGSNDPQQSPEDVQAFEAEMHKTMARWVDLQLIFYKGVGHDFTQPGSKSYDKRIDQISWQAMQNFLHEIFSMR